MIECALYSLNRRVLLNAAVAAIGTGLASCSSVGQPSGSRPGAIARFAYVGSRTTRERNARGEGIQVYRVNPSTGGWTHVQLVSDLVNPSFLAFDKTQRFLYAVHGDMSEVRSFSVDAGGGELKFLNRQSTEGKNPAHLMVDDSNRYLIVANYATGSLAVLPRNDDGSLGAVRQLESLPGTPGPHKVDQGSSHPHHLVYDHRRQHILVPDKELDRIFSYTFDSTLGKLVAGAAPFVQVRPGAGPRHIVFHPSEPFAFVAHELDSSVGAYRLDADRGALSPIQIIPSIPDSFTGANTAAEIEISSSGRYLFVSNRRSDTIGAFSVDRASGRLGPIAWTSSAGEGPRFFTIDPSGRWLYAANENSDTIVPFQIDSDSGRLRSTNQVVRTGSPVCIVFSTI